MPAIRFAAAVSLAALIAAPAYAQTAPVPPEVPVVAAPLPPQVVPAGDTIETLRASGQFRTLLKALDTAGLTAVIKGQKTLTLFAPNDAAFAALPAGELERLMRDPPKLQALLMYHLVNAPVDAAKIGGARGPIATVSNAGLVLDGLTGPGLMVNDAHVVQTDIRTPNGLIHVVDRVLKPEVGAAITARINAEAAAEAQAGATPAQ
jgi:uncharacterized surface protein with fasciclin (FAS1) repeats